MQAIKLLERVCSTKFVLCYVKYVKVFRKKFEKELAQKESYRYNSFLLAHKQDGRGRLAQRESTSFTRKGSSVQSRQRPPLDDIMGDWRSGSAGALQAQGHRFKSCIAHHFKLTKERKLRSFFVVCVLPMLYFFFGFSKGLLLPIPIDAVFLGLLFFTETVLCR